ncbi:DUF5980 family protein [Streptomyces johnsoniae]|uniref:DUF5980 family protein n=1 Tax=Streptomyces johnsoniae TaxID=3075532 RepID=A0ABU2RY75_9ACTN|nr:DUF5980 family protein [Streptomyces sp. DSM 41886]MDT0441711.1 DUF5980 family protein [Streptomyces sp. DSM 41886]
MNATRRAAGILSGLLAASMLTLVGATPASAAATWTLVDYPGHPQRICVHPERGWPRTYVGLPISGYWDTRIDGEVRNLPPGSYSNGGAVHPGDWDEDRQKFIGLVHVSIAPTPVGEYVAELWASDGTDTQTAPVVISVKEDCLGD